MKPLIRSPLVRRNRLRHRRSLEAANRLAEKINSLITNVKSKQYSDLTNASAQDLWDAIKGKTQKSNANDRYRKIISLSDIVISFFASVAIANDYNADEMLTCIM